MWRLVGHGRRVERQRAHKGATTKQSCPFLLMGWVECTVGTAYDWVRSGLLFIECTGHTYQQKHQEVADNILQLIRDWQEVAFTSLNL